MAATRSSDAGCGSPPMCRLSPTRVTSSRYGRDPHTGQHRRPGRDGGAVLAAVAVADHPAGGGADGGAGGAELHGPAPGRDRPLGVVARAGGDEHAQQVRARALERGEGLPDGDLGRALQVRARRHPVAEPPSVRHACLPRSPPIVAAVGADGHHPPALSPGRRPPPPPARALATTLVRRRATRRGAHNAGASGPPPAPKRRSGGVSWGSGAVERGLGRAPQQVHARVGGAFPHVGAATGERRGRERSPGRRRW